MNKIVLFIILQLIVFTAFAQTNKELALEKAKEAITIMDEGRIDESIKLLEESQKLDPINYSYPYEIAYAHVLTKDYNQALKILKKIKKYDTLNSQVYQMSGNCYSYLGKPERAIKEYEEGMERFPNAGNLHLEKGNVYHHQEEYDQAIVNYQKGIEVDPTFASNYFRLAKLYLNSPDKLSGLIDGEIFMNLERTTDRTIEMSELLYETYKSSITFGDTDISIDFCEINIDATKVNIDEPVNLPFCGIFGKNITLAIIEEKEITLNSLSRIRERFIENYYQEDLSIHQNILFAYQKELLDKNLFDAYNHYLFQIGNEKEYNEWLDTHQKEYDAFVEWYTNDENTIDINIQNRFVK
ncbi:tetratricopeptide repeat protein [Dokdonia sp. Hel_I_63]|uniref:tetratricopeptide repeat protein n=1 Tax=unclassified Dokdonia TaxID=2615033 RepID=UPI00020A78FF|nr:MULTISPECIES: tetratricopeptide repeat protein [unclassified Dokdonia]AEE20415.1 Tetratricopeptide TPR_1 repeat-containing protein [Dokdonia sp. 4H-3-7-5]TVZ23329.1 tetratricopeptide repeat protein [Dokdonia sp. Hel_I_63]